MATRWQLFKSANKNEFGNPNESNALQNDKFSLLKILVIKRAVAGYFKFT